MILFYDKVSGDIFAAIDGRVHDESHLNMYIKHGENEVGKLIIGEIESNKDGKRSKVKYNEHLMSHVYSFEDITSDSPLDYKVENGALLKKLNNSGNIKSIDKKPYA